MNPRVRAAAKNLALFAVSLFLVFVAIEVVLRTTHLFNARLSFTQPDRLIAWSFTPGREYWAAYENDHPIVGRINSHGWLDRERAMEKPDGVFRVAVLGDSFVEAMQVELDSTFLAIAERKLGRKGARVELLNFGRSDATTTEEILILERDANRFDPDLVVLCFWPRNDIDDVNPATATNPLRPYVKLMDDGKLELDASFTETAEFKRKLYINPFKQRSALISLLAVRYNVWKRARRWQALGAVSDTLSIREELTLCTATPDPVFAANYALCKRIAEEIEDICQRRDAGFLFVCLADVYDPARAAEFRALDSTFNEDFFDEDLSQWAASRGIDYLGMQRPFRERLAATGEELHWAHWNYAGHRLAARVLAEAIDGYVE